MPCATAPAEHAHYVDDRDECSWKCDFGFHVGVFLCERCHLDCPIGEYRKGCTNSSKGSCAPCTGRPHAAHFNGSGGIEDACPWECNSNFRRHNGDCIPCEERCPPGEYLSGCVETTPGTCSPCTNRPANAHYTNAGGLHDACPWECNTRFHRVGNICMACAADCPVGSYRRGCEGSLEGICVPCGVLRSMPAHSHQSGHGGLQDACPWECNAGFYKSAGPSAHCLPCNDSSCAVGAYLVDCFGDQAGTCVACTQGTWVSRYTGNGGLEDACPQECRVSWPVSAPCLFALIANRMIVVLGTLIVLGCGIAASSRLRNLNSRGRQGLQTVFPTAFEYNRLPWAPDQSARSVMQACCSRCTDGREPGVKEGDTPASLEEFRTRVYSETEEAVHIPRISPRLSPFAGRDSPREEHFMTAAAAAAVAAPERVDAESPRGLARHPKESKPVEGLASGKPVPKSRGMSNYGPGARGWSPRSGPHAGPTTETSLPLQPGSPQQTSSKSLADPNQERLHQ